MDRVDLLTGYPIIVVVNVVVAAVVACTSLINPSVRRQSVDYRTIRFSWAFGGSNARKIDHYSHSSKPFVVLYPSSNSSRWARSLTDRPIAESGGPRRPSLPPGRLVPGSPPVRSGRRQVYLSGLSSVQNRVSASNFGQRSTAAEAAAAAAETAALTIGGLIVPSEELCRW